MVFPYLNVKIKFSFYLQHYTKMATATSLVISDIPDIPNDNPDNDFSPVGAVNSGDIEKEDDPTFINDGDDDDDSDDEEDEETEEEEDDGDDENDEPTLKRRRTRGDATGSSASVVPAQSRSRAKCVNTSNIIDRDPTD